MTQFTKTSGPAGVSSKITWEIFDPENGPVTYTVISDPQPVKAGGTKKNKSAKKLPSLAALNAKMDADSKFYRQASIANTLRLTGRPNL